jgi:hypothetical protein
MYFFCFVFNENMLRKLLGFDRMLENKIYIFFVFRNEIFFIIIILFWRKPDIFNTRSVSYSVNIQPDIMQNY